MRVWEDRIWRLIFLGLSIAALIVGILGGKDLIVTMQDVAEKVQPVFQAPPPPEPCDCDKKQPPAKPKMEVIEEPRR